MTEQNEKEWVLRRAELGGWISTAAASCIFMDVARIWRGIHQCFGISCNTWCDMGVLDLVGGLWFSFAREVSC